MLRKKLNNIIKDIDRQIRACEIVDTVVEFEKIRMVEDFRKENKSNNIKKGVYDVVAKRNIKRTIKYKILKPGFKMMYRVNPSIAINIRNLIYTIVHRLKNGNKVKNNISLKKQENQIDVLIDSTVTSKTEFTTGIQRVVKNIIINLDNDVVTGTTYGWEYQTNFAYQNKLKSINSNNDEYEIDFKRINKG